MLMFVSFVHGQLEAPHPDTSTSSIDVALPRSTVAEIIDPVMLADLNNKNKQSLSGMFNVRRLQCSTEIVIRFVICINSYLLRVAHSTLLSLFFTSLTQV